MCKQPQGSYPQKLWHDRIGIEVIVLTDEE